MAKRTLAVAGGHTNTRLALLDEDSIRAAKLDTGLNLYPQSDDEFVSTLRRGLEQLGLAPECLPETDLRLILPGVKETLIEQTLASSGMAYHSLSVIDDTVGVLLANLGNLDGICAFAGSGAAVLSGIEISGADYIPSFLGTLDGKLDGFGPLVGDFGSGFRFASEILSTAVRAAERIKIQEATATTNNEGAELLTWMCQYDNELFEIHKWIRSFQQSVPEFWTARVAKLAIPVVKKVEQARENGTLESEIASKPQSALAYAVDALERAAIQLANTVKISLMRQPDDLDVPIICHGGMFENSEHYFETFKSELRTYAGEIRRASYHYVIGGFLVGENQQQPDEQIYQHVIRLINRLPPSDATRRLLEFL